MRSNAAAVDSHRTPGEGKYARLERERRFLLRELPPGTMAARLIEDRYVHGTRLRLRRVTGDGAAPVYKFCQKVRPDEAEPSTVAITNMYLSEAEYERLSQLPAATLRKTRRAWRVGPHSFAVDELHDALAGLVLAEIDVGEGEHPSAPGPEVTRDLRFTGGYLAHATPAQIDELLGVARAVRIGQPAPGSLAG